MKARIQKILSDLRSRLAGIYGPRLCNVVLFGSQARGDAEPDSDIDVLVVLEGEVSPCEEIARTEILVSDVSLSHDACVCCVFVSEAQFQREQSPLMLNVRREGVAV
jgi:predicted nucleotidyltransferase